MKENGKMEMLLSAFFKADKDFQMQRYANSRSPMSWEQRRLFYIISHKYSKRFNTLTPESLWPLLWEQANG